MADSDDKKNPNMGPSLFPLIHIHPPNHVHTHTHTYIHIYTYTHTYIPFSLPSLVLKTASLLSLLATGRAVGMGNTFN